MMMNVRVIFLRLSFLLLAPTPLFCCAQQDSTDHKGQEKSESRIQSFQLRPVAFIAPAVLVGYGAFAGGNNFINDLDRTTRAELQEDHPLFSSKMDNFMQYAPAAAVYALHLAGVKGRHGTLDATGAYLVSFAIMKASTECMKSATQRLRPDGSTRNSFPSGHTATSFTSAEFLMQEYKDVSPWIGYGGYAVAITTGVFRLYNNRHWVSDVVAGAGFGIASAKLGYFFYPKLKRLIAGRHAAHMNFVPVYQQGAAGFSFSGQF